MARLSIPDEATFAEFDVETSTSAFPITFRLFAKADLTVMIDGMALAQSAFTFSGTLLEGGGYDGGTVTLNSAVDDVTVRIERNVAPVRASQFAPSNSVPVGSIDMALNRLTATQQDLARSKLDEPTFEREGKFLAFDAEGSPIAASGTGADAGLRTDLAASGGGALVKFSPSGPGAVTRSVQDKLADTISVNDHGAVGDGITDNTAAVNRAVLVAALNGGGEISFGAADDKYIVVGPVYVPNHVVINLNGQVLEGVTPAGGVMFQTATVEAGVLTSNIGSPPETKIVRFAKIKNGIIRNTGLVFNFYNFEYGCSIEDVATETCLQVGKFDRCFYMKMDNVSARGYSDIAFPTYHFAGENNNITLTRVSGVTQFPFLFEGGTTNVGLTQCSVEGGGKGVVFRDDCLGVRVNFYAENIAGTAIDLSEVGTGYFEFSGSYFRLVDVILDDGGATDAGTVLFGTWDSSNFVPAPAASPARARMQIDGAFNFIKFDGVSNNGGTATVPANIIRKSSTIAHHFSSVADGAGAYARSDVWAGIAPRLRCGDVGAGVAGTVPFAIVSYPTGDPVTATVTTNIVWRPTMLRATYLLTVTEDTVGTSVLFGDVYGGQIKQGDAVGKTVTVSDSGGFLRISIDGLKNAAGIRTITGSVEIV